MSENWFIYHGQLIIFGSIIDYLSLDGVGFVCIFAGAVGIVCGVAYLWIKE